MEEELEIWEVFITFLLEVAIKLVGHVLKPSITTTKNTVDSDVTRWKFSFQFKNQNQLVYTIGCLE